MEEGGGVENLARGCGSTERRGEERSTRNVDASVASPTARPFGSSNVVVVVADGMEDELKCPVCHHFFTQPVLLPCFHSLCLQCAVSIQVAVVGGGGSNAPSIVQQQQQQHIDDDSDQLSILSETDSGVVVNSTTSSSSRPSSYLSSTTVVPASLSLSCPVCRKVVYFDENGAQNLPRYRAMQTIVDKYSDSKPATTAAAAAGQAQTLTLCQLCCPEQSGGQQEASVFCQQCQVFYCNKCQCDFHPARGPLAKHSLVSPHQGRLALLRSQQQINKETAKVKTTLSFTLSIDEKARAHKNKERKLDRRKN